MKNPKPSILAFYSSIIIAAIAGIVCGFISHNTSEIIIVAVTVLIVSYAIFFYVLQIFIYRKIKLVYKSIHHLKSGKEESSLKEKLNEDPLDMVNKEVMEWENEKVISGKCG